jgi:Mn2+/Fe2+ NRAMP family transporter
MNIKDTTPSTEETTSNSFWDTSLVLFFLAPIIFLFITFFTGNTIFYGKAGEGKKDSRQVWLLSAGSLFYMIVLIIALS